jgi:hypothetical protein
VDKIHGEAIMEIKEKAYAELKYLAKNGFIIRVANIKEYIKEIEKENIKLRRELHDIENGGC